MFNLRWCQQIEMSVRNAPQRGERCYDLDPAAGSKSFSINLAQYDSDLDEEVELAQKFGDLDFSK